MTPAQGHVGKRGSQAHVDEAFLPLERKPFASIEGPLVLEISAEL